MTPITVVSTIQNLRLYILYTLKNKQSNLTPKKGPLHTNHKSSQYFTHKNIDYFCSWCIFDYLFLSVQISDLQSKNAVSTNMKHSRYIRLLSNFSSIHFQTKGCMDIMFDIVVYSLQLWKRIDRQLITSGIFQD